MKKQAICQLLKGIDQHDRNMGTLQSDSLNFLFDKIIIQMEKLILKRKLSLFTHIRAL